MSHNEILIISLIITFFSQKFILRKYGKKWSYKKHLFYLDIENYMICKKGTE